MRDRNAGPAGVAHAPRLAAMGLLLGMARGPGADPHRARLFADVRRHGAPEHRQDRGLPVHLPGRGHRHRLAVLRAAPGCSATDGRCGDGRCHLVHRAQWGKGADLMSADPQSLVFVPALMTLLTAAENRKGSPLTEDEVCSIRDQATRILSHN